MTEFIWITVITTISQAALLLEIVFMGFICIIVIPTILKIVPSLTTLMEDWY
jgi:hypothetical protein